MTTEHLIGEITLSISTFFYIIWFLPQLWLNFKRKDTEGLSYWMHGLLFVGYSCDLMYGFGVHMQWQYRFSTIWGLACLCIQHFQIGRYGLHRRTEKWTYIAISTIVTLVILLAFMTLRFTHESKGFYNWMGMLSNLCWLTYFLPQIIRNYIHKSTQGLSVWFVIVSILMSVCDVTSALMLNWDWPSLVGVPIDLTKKGIVLFQLYYYRKRTKYL